ncbi:MAG: hypothetical protein ACLFPN_06130 [Methanomassiliicoccales archaeon]
MEGGLELGSIRALPKADKRKFIRRDREGVASTVGTIMALLVFLTFLGLFTNTYVPLWMTDNERTHMNEVMNQMGEFKARLDSMIVNAQITDESSINVYTPVTLGAEGVPVFASQTAGVLSYEPAGSSNDSGISISFSYDDDEEVVDVEESGGGKLEFYAPNRYFVQQWVAFENGAIVIKQSDGQSLRAHPSMEVEKLGDNNVSMVFTQVDLLGKNNSVAGTGSAGMNTKLTYLDSQQYDVNDSDNEVTINITTQYGEAWTKFLERICKDGGLINGTDYSIDPGDAGSDVRTITFSVFNCANLDYNRAYVSVSVQR